MANLGSLHHRRELRWRTVSVPGVPGDPFKFDRIETMATASKTWSRRRVREYRDRGYSLDRIAMMILSEGDVT